MLAQNLCTICVLWWWSRQYIARWHRQFFAVVVLLCLLYTLKAVLRFPSCFQASGNEPWALAGPFCEFLSSGSMRTLNFATAMIAGDAERTFSHPQQKNAKVMWICMCLWGWSLGSGTVQLNCSSVLTCFYSDIHSGLLVCIPTSNSSFHPTNWPVFVIISSLSDR